MSIVTVGDNVVDRYPALGRAYPGGNCVNVAVQVARSGERAAYLGVVGDDALGGLVSGALRAEHVEVERLRVAAGRTATADVGHVDGDRVFVGSDKGVSLFELVADDLAYIAGFDLAHSSYCSGLEPQLPEIAARVAVSYDFADRREPGYAAPLLAHTTVASFSAGDLDESETEELVRWAAGQGPRVVLATRGSGGAVLFDGHTLHRQAAVPTTVVDTLGAGDAFIARVLVGVLRGESPQELLAAAATRGAAACTHHGGFGHPAPLAHDTTVAQH